jgi:hypothetical protein
LKLVGGWKEYEDIFASQITMGHKLLLPVIFMDEYEQQRQRNDSVTGVYSSLANITGKEVNYNWNLFDHQFSMENDP